MKNSAFKQCKKIGNEQNRFLDKVCTTCQIIYKIKAKGRNIKGIDFDNSKEYINCPYRGENNFHLFVKAP